MSVNGAGGKERAPAARHGSDPALSPLFWEEWHLSGGNGVSWLPLPGRPPQGTATVLGTPAWHQASDHAAGFNPAPGRTQNPLGSDKTTVCAVSLGLMLLGKGQGWCVLFGTLRWVWLRSGRESIRGLHGLRSDIAAWGSLGSRGLDPTQVRLSLVYPPYREQSWHGGQLAQQALPQVEPCFFAPCMELSARTGLLDGHVAQARHSLWGTADAQPNGSLDNRFIVSAVQLLFLRCTQLASRWQRSFAPRTAATAFHGWESLGLSGARWSGMPPDALQTLPGTGRSCGAQGC